ncbi:MAG: multiheme c-type cytochrome [Planctomycetota bacterium]
MPFLRSTRVVLWVATCVVVAGLAVVAADPPPGAGGNPAADDSSGNPSGASSSGHKTPAPPPRTPHGKTFEVAFTVNNLGYIDVCGCKHKKVRMGSVARRQSYIRQATAAGRTLLLVDGGNCLFHNDNVKVQDHERVQILERSKVLVESMNRMGYKAMAVGHYDLVLGLDTLKEFEQQAKFPFLCANYVNDAGELIFPPTTEVEVDGIKVGILGLTLATIQPHYLERRAPGTRVTDPIEAARRYVPELRQRNQVVIVLSHNKVELNRTLAEQVAGIDFIVDPYIQMGNHKLWLEDNEVTERIGTCTIVRTDSQGARLGLLDLDVVPTGAPFSFRPAEEVPAGKSSFAFSRVSIEPHFLEDPEIQLMVEAFRKGTAFVNTATLPPLPDKDKYLTASTCQACHVDQYNFWQSTKHAHAFASLEATNDQWRQDCIGCHVLGYGQTFVAPAEAEPYKNVQCESCHGLNPEHPQDPKAHQWPRIQETACLTCHNERQTFSEFKFGPMRQKVACPPLTR